MIDKQTTMEELAVPVSMTLVKAAIAAMLSDGAAVSICGENAHESAAAADAGKRKWADRS